MSGLSNRVMNMKFMQKADAMVETKKTEEKEKKIKDLSEWVLPNSSQLLKNRKDNTVKNIGYTSINSFSNANLEFDDDNEDISPVVPARRTWGSEKKKISNNDEPKLNITNLKMALNNKANDNSKNGKDANDDSSDEQNNNSAQKPTKSKKRKNNVDTSSNKKKKTN